MTPAARKALYWSRVAQRLCIDCAAGLQEDDKRRCVECAATAIKTNRAWRQSAKGRAKSRARDKRRRDEARAAGLCMDLCGQPAVPGRARCADHLATASARQAAYLDRCESEGAPC